MKCIEYIRAAAPSSRMDIKSQSKLKRKFPILPEDIAEIANVRQNDPTIEVLHIVAILPPLAPQMERPIIPAILNNISMALAVASSISGLICIIIRVILVAKNPPATIPITIRVIL